MSNSLKETAFHLMETRAKSLQFGTKNGITMRVAGQLSMTTMPRAMMELILSFAVKNVSEAKVLPTKLRGWKRLRRPSTIPLALIAEWRLVCHYWCDLLGEILVQYKQRIVKLNLSHKSANQQSIILRNVTSTGSRVVELRVAMFGHTTRHVGTELTQVVDWQVLLRSCPNLQRLDVSKMAYVTRYDLAKILDAASQYCLKMKALVLPLPMQWNERASKRMGVNRNDVDDVALMKHLSTALERWFTRGHCQGLRQLVIPHIPAVSSQFLTAVTRFCPKVEILDGWKLTYVSDGWGAALCDEEWRVSLMVWESFCSKCVDLREFNWAVVPFTDAFFIPFGATPKCRLTDLSFDFTDAFLRRKQVLTSTNSVPATIGFLVAAEQLIQTWSLQVAAAIVLAQEAENMLLPHASRPYSSTGLCSLVRGLPYLRSFKVFCHPRYRIDLDVFDDAFVRQLATTSPYLGQFCFSEAGKYTGPQSLECVSAQGLLSLAKMTHLSDISIAALSSSSGDGVFSFIASMSPILHQRNVKIGVMRDFDTMIIPLLELVTVSPAGMFTDKTFALLVVNVGHLRGYSQKVSQSQTWEGTLSNLRRQIEVTHPKVRFQLTMEKEKPRPGTVNATRGGDFYSMSKLSVFTTDWQYQDVMGSTFYRGDILYSMPFEWIIKC